MALEYNEGYDVLLCAWERTNEERLYQRWINGVQEHMGFDDFKKKLGIYGSLSDTLTNGGRKLKNAGPQSEEEIFNKVKGIIDGTVYSIRKT